MYWAEHIFFQSFNLKYHLTQSVYSIHTLIPSTLLDCANTLIDFEKSFKGFGLDRVFKDKEFVLMWRYTHMND